jgi:ATP-binding cassette, subfamily B, bacterial
VPRRRNIPVPVPDPAAEPMPAAVPVQPPSPARQRVVRRGLQHVGRAIREQRGIFALAVLGSSLYGGMTVASAFVIGGITDRVLLPAFADGATTAGALTLASLAIIVVAVLGSSLYGGMTVASAFVIGGITDRVLLPAFADGATTAGALTLASLAIIVVAVLKILGILGRRLFAGIMSYRLMADYRRRVTGQYLRLPLSWHQRHPTGQLLSNANSDVESSWFFVSPLPFACGALVMIAITVAALVLTDPLLAIVGFVVFPLVFVVNAVYSQVMSPRMARAQQLRAEVSEIAHESFDAALVVKTLGREADETRRFAVKADELRDGLIAVGRVRGLFDPLMEALPNLGTLAVLLVGAERVAAGATAAGDLVSIAYLFTLLALPIRAIGWVLADLPRAMAGFDRVTPVLQATGETPHGPDAAPAGTGGAGLGVRDVDFRYDAHAPRTLSGITFDVVPGRTVAVVGPTGSGKSTLAGLLVRLVDPHSGAVLLDDVDLRNLREGEVSSQVAFVPQSTFLFDDTVRDNVTLGADFDDEQVTEALRIAAADDFVARLPEGLDTRVGERGASLSGGQRQRLALARAVVRQPRLLVLDDATSAVDPSVEARILDALRTSDRPATVVVVAYRQATIALADEVVWIERGRLVARGTHTQLLAEVPGYARLVQAYQPPELADGRTGEPVEVGA